MNELIHIGNADIAVKEYQGGRAETFSTTNNLQWKVVCGENKLPGRSSSFRLGALYAVEYGERLKIGCTRNLKQRTKTLQAQAKGYSECTFGAVAYTAYHIDYRQNERLLHEMFAHFRRGGTELFDLSLNSFLADCPILPLSENATSEDSLATAQALLKYFHS